MPSQSAEEFGKRERLHAARRERLGAHMARFRKLQDDSMARRDAQETGRLSFIAQTRSNYYEPLNIKQEQDLQPV